MSFYPEVSILIVNYYTAAELISCLESLAAQQDVLYEVIIVDNSDDLNEQQLLQKVTSERVQCIFSTENLGFGRANNLAAQHAGADLLLILNPDTFFEETTLLRRYIDRFKAGNDAMLAPLIVESSKKKLIYPRYKYPSQAFCKKTDFSVLSGQIAWVLGACMMISRKDYLNIHGFDDDYFVYGEDADICWRIRAELGSIGFDESLEVHHIGGASEKKSINLAKWMRKRQGQYLFFKKHYHQLDLINIVLKKRMQASLKLAKNALLSRWFGKPSLNRLDEDARATATLAVTAEILSSIKEQRV
jgi:N-acetylglucosaminyl-diphospho-decaprenol L-rhamnosyltransferase